VADKPPRLRTIIKEPAFELALHNLIERSRDADEFIEHAELTLARNPRVGTQITTGNKSVWFLPMVTEKRIKNPLVLYYTFDSDRVYLLHVQCAILEVEN
jgi:hypothetical protein